MVLIAVLLQNFWEILFMYQMIKIIPIYVMNSFNQIYASKFNTSEAMNMWSHVDLTPWNICVLYFIYIVF